MDPATSQTLTIRSPFQTAVLASFSLLVIFTLGNQILFKGRAPLHWWTDLWWTLTSLTAGLLCLNVRRRGLRDHQVWLFFGLGCVSWALGMVAWGIYELALNRISPFPSIADAGYILSTVLILAGSLLLLKQRYTFYEGARLFIDSLILINFLLVVLLVIFYGTISRSEVSLTGKAVALLHPIFPIAIAYVLMDVRRRVEKGVFRDGLDWVSTGMVLMILANMGYLVPIITGGYTVGSLLDPLWIASFLCIGLGALKILLHTEPLSDGEQIAGQTH